MHPKVIDMLRKMYHRRIIGGKHTEEVNILRSMKHISRDEQDVIYADWEKCVQREWVVRMKKTNQIHVALNPRMIAEIVACFEERYGHVL